LGTYLGPKGGADCVLISVLAGKSVVEKALGKRGLAAALLAQEHHLQLYVGHQEEERTGCAAPRYSWGAEILINCLKILRCRYRTGTENVLFPIFSICSSNEKNGNIIKVKDC
jgi:hypothetical protein